MTVKLLTEHHLEFLSLKEAAQAHLSLLCQNATLMELMCHDSFVLDGNSISSSYPNKGWS